MDIIILTSTDVWYNAVMDELEKERVRQWVRNWQVAGPVLKRLRDEAIANANTAEAIEMLSDAFESARLHWTPPTTSGLVEQQRWFARLRR
jgi:hypothetical protein